jgi:hypothetical protein
MIAAEPLHCCAPDAGGMYGGRVIRRAAGLHPDRKADAQHKDYGPVVVGVRRSVVEADDDIRLCSIAVMSRNAREAL